MHRMPRRQKQRQSQKQTVIVNISEPRKKKRSGRRRKSVPRDGVSSMQQALPPPVIYQSSYSIPYPVQAPPPIQAPVKERGFLTDVGQVGTEGPVEIIDVKTKKEQLSELTSPVQSQIAGLRDTEEFNRAIKDYWTGKQADYSNKPVASMPAPPSQPMMQKTDDLSKLREKVSQKMDLLNQQREAYEQINVGIEPVKVFDDYPMTQKQKPIDEQISPATDREGPTPVAKYEPPVPEKKKKAKADAPEMTPVIGAEKKSRIPRMKRPVALGNKPIEYLQNEYKQLTGKDFVFPKGVRSKKPALISAIEYERTTTKA